ncbi:unnamed protein product [Calypogeia fissa]
MGPKRQKLQISRKKSQEVDTTAEGRRSAQATINKQPVDDTKKRKRGRPKKSESDREEVVEAAVVEATVVEAAVVAVAADVKESAPTPEEQSGPEKVKRGRGRPKKPRNDPAEEPEAAPSVKQRSPSIPQEDAKPMEEANKRKRGNPKKSSSGVQSVEEKQKRTSGRLKKPKSETPETRVRRAKPSLSLAANGGEEVGPKRRGRRSKASVEQKPASKASRTKAPKKANPKSSPPAPKKARRHYLPNVEVDGIVFHEGDDVYIKKMENDGPESDSEAEDCRICGIADEVTMLECDSCLNGFHLTCFSPPLDSVPEGDWKCPYCENGETAPAPPGFEQRHRSARERLLGCDLWAARIERIWRDSIDGKFWFTAHWFLVPEDTKMGRQPHHGKRELFRSNKSDYNEMDSILRRCHVISGKDFKNSAGEGDDVFFCDFEYNEKSGRFTQIDVNNGPA